jgi:anti-sigma B factor antagonist
MLILDGDFDRSNVAQFEQEIQQALQVSGVKLILDLRGVSSLDSTMRTVLVRVFGAAAGHGGNLALIRPNPVVWRVFVLTDQSRSVPAFGRLDEALASFQPAS